nr:hypothetical protein [Sedimentibacter sp.]
MKKIILMVLVFAVALSVFAVNAFADVSDFRVSETPYSGSKVEKARFSEGENIIYLEKNPDGTYKRQTIYAESFWTDDSSGVTEEKSSPISMLHFSVVNSNADVVNGTVAGAIHFYTVGEGTVTYTTIEFMPGMVPPMGIGHTYTVKFKVVEKEEEKDFSVAINHPSSLTAGQDANITATATNNTTSGSAIKSALLIVTLYDESGKMVNYSYAEKDVPAGESIALGAGFRLPEGSEGYKVQAVVWDGWPDDSDLSKGKPLSDAVNITVQ